MRGEQKKQIEKEEQLKLQQGGNTHTYKKLGLTQPKSPDLITKTRAKDKLALDNKEAKEEVIEHVHQENRLKPLDFGGNHLIPKYSFKKKHD